MAALLPMAVLPVALLSMHTITMATLHTRHVHATSASATPALLLSYSLTKARSAAETDKYGKPADDEVAFHAARALSLLSSHAANQRKILRHGGLKPMYALAPTAAPTRTRALTRAPALFTLSPSPTQTRYALARLADPDIQAEAATVIANVTSTIYDAQMQVSTLTLALAPTPTPTLTPSPMLAPTSTRALARSPPLAQTSIRFPTLCRTPTLIPTLNPNPNPSPSPSPSPDEGVCRRLAAPAALPRLLRVPRGAVRRHARPRQPDAEHRLRACTSCAARALDPPPSPSALALDPCPRPTLTPPLTPIVTLTLIPIVTLTLT